MAPSQEANNDNLRKSFDFLHNHCMLSVFNKRKFARRTCNQSMLPFFSCG